MNYYFLKFFRRGCHINCSLKPRFFLFIFSQTIIQYQLFTSETECLTTRQVSRLMKEECEASEEFRWRVFYIIRPRRAENFIQIFSCLNNCILSPHIPRSQSMLENLLFCCLFYWFIIVYDRNDFMTGLLPASEWCSAVQDYAEEKLILLTMKNGLVSTKQSKVLIFKSSILCLHYLC